MRKKGVALFVAALMIAALPLGAGAQVNPFSDVRADHWAYDAIIKLAAVGLVEGYPDGTFGGDRTFTRYEMAMVFARLLARLEALIDQKIAEGIDVKTEELARQIAAVHEELSKRIADNYDDLLARIRALELELGDLEAALGITGPAGALSDEARAALAAQLTDDMLAQLRALLQEDLDDLARRIANLEESILDEGDVERIARRVIADALGVDADALEAGDVVATGRLVERRVDELEQAVAALAEEFRSELDQLGVRVSVLEARVDEHEQKIAGILDRLGNVRITGKNETVYEQTSIKIDDLSWDGKFYVDPRDEDSEELTRGNEFRNKFTLVFTATPAENVEVKGTFAATTQLGETVEDADAFDVVSDLWVTTPGVLRSLHVGELDAKQVSADYSKYVLVADKLDDPDEEGDEKRGADMNLVWGQGDSTNVRAFLSRVEVTETKPTAPKALDDDELIYGAYARYKLSDAFDLTFSGVRYVNAPDTVDTNIPADIPDQVDDRVFSVQSEGVLDTLQYTAFFAQHQEYDAAADEYTSANVVEAHLTLPVAFATASFDYGSVDLEYAPRFAKDLDAGKDMVFKGLDWLERKLTPAEDWLDRGESTYQAKLSAPIFGLQASAAFGKLTANKGDHTNPLDYEEITNDFVQAELSGLNWAGIEAGLLYDRRAYEVDPDQVDTTLRATFGATPFGLNVQATLHNRKNEQDWLNRINKPGEAEQQHTWVTLGHSFNVWSLPIKLEGRFGASQTSGTDNHTFAGITVEEFPVGPFALTAGYSISRNDVDAEKWWINEKWTNKNVDTATFGLGYTFVDFFGVDLKTGYEYKFVREEVGGVTSDYSRNTFKASFEKELRNAAKLAGEGKVVTGYVPDDKRDGTDVTAKLSLTYPVFEGANLEVGGLYVSSKDNTVKDDNGKKPDYTAYQVKAGLAFEF